MTLPNQERVALLNTTKFLYELLDPSKTPNVPKNIRENARICLKHFPPPIRIDEIYNAE